MAVHCKDRTEQNVYWHFVIICEHLSKVKYVYGVKDRIIIT